MIFGTGREFRFFVKQPSVEKYEEANFGNKLAKNLILLGLNPGKMEAMTPPFHFFHKRLKDGIIIQTESEQNLYKYTSESKLPFYGAYMTDLYNR